MDSNAFIERLFDRARAAGFEACEAYLTEHSAFQVNVNAGEITRYNVSESLELGFRGLWRGRMGCASTQVLDDGAADLLVSAARSGAELIEGEQAERIFEGSPAYPAFDGAHPEIAAMTAVEKIALARELERRTLDFDPRIASVRACALYTGEARTRLINSRGLDLYTHRDRLEAYVSPVARSGERTGTAGRDACAPTPAALDLDRLAREAAGEAVAFLDAQSLPSGRYPVLFRPDAAAQLLETFASLFSGDAARKGLSLFRSREGERVAAPCVTLVDDPLLPEGYASRAFDGEGVASRATRVVEDGVLNTLLHNLRTAQWRGVETTASAARALCAGPITVSPSNFYLAPGALDAPALYAQAGNALLVTELMGLHSGANSVSGDFSLGAKGFLIRNGRIDRAVNGITIAGNFTAMLREIEAVGSDLRFGASRFASPTILVRSLSLAGDAAASGRNSSQYCPVSSA